VCVYPCMTLCVCVCLHSLFCIDGSLPLLFQLISRLASLFGRELCMKYFVPLFPSLGSDTMFHVRKVRTGGRKRGRGGKEGQLIYSLFVCYFTGICYELQGAMPSAGGGSNRGACCECVMDPCHSTDLIPIPHHYPLSTIQHTRHAHTCVQC